MKKSIYKIIKFLLILILLSASSVLYYLLLRWTNGWPNVVVIALLGVYIIATKKTIKTISSPEIETLEIDGKKYRKDEVIEMIKERGLKEIK